MPTEVRYLSIYQLSCQPPTNSPASLNYISPSPRGLPDGGGGPFQPKPTTGQGPHRLTRATVSSPDHQGALRITHYARIADHATPSTEYRYNYHHPNQQHLRCDLTTLIWPTLRKSPTDSGPLPPTRTGPVLCKGPPLRNDSRRAWHPFSAASRVQLQRVALRPSAMLPICFEHESRMHGAAVTEFARSLIVAWAAIVPTSPPISTDAPPTEPPIVLLLL